VGANTRQQSLQLGSLTRETGSHRFWSHSLRMRRCG
jgi:hypothetical protein